MRRAQSIRGALWLAALLAASAPPWGAAGMVEAQPLVWRVQSRVQGAGATHYIAGSVHALRDSDYPLPAAYDRAYAATAQLVLEVDLGAIDASAARDAALAAGKLPRRATLCKLLGSVDCAEAERLAQAAGVSLRPVARFEPWLAALTLTSESLRAQGLDAGLGVDRHLFGRAQADRRPVRGLETAADQFAAFDGLTPALQRRLLLDSLKQLPTLPVELEAIVTAWRDGDIAALVAQQGGIGESPELQHAVLTARHARWLPQLQPLLAATTPTLVVVGAQHLVGPDSILLALERAGFVLQRVD